MRVAIIGAGIAGLAAARALKQAGLTAVVFEANEAVGGRAMTVHMEGCLLDAGATTITPRGLAIQKTMQEELPTEDLVQCTLPINQHSRGRILPGDRQKNLAYRFCYRHGMAQLPGFLAHGLDVRYSTRVDEIVRPGDGGFSVAGDCFEWVIVTGPAPAANQLLVNSRIDRSLRRVSYRACISVLLAFEEEFTAGWQALVDPEHTEPLTFLSVESLKCPGSRAPEGWTAVTAQMSRRYSAEYMDRPDEEIVSDVLVDVSRLMGSRFGKAAHTRVVRWPHSQPENTISFEAANPHKTHLLIAGDGVEGPRVELAYESGIKAALRVLSS